MKKILFQELPIEELSALISKRLINEIIPHLPRQESDEYFTRKETAKKLKVSLPTLHTWTKQGLIKSYRIGSRIRFKRSDLQNALNEIPYLKRK